MPREFTDTENTGAPLVPMETEIARGRSASGDDRQYLEEMVWSHRLE